MTRGEAERSNHNVSDDTTTCDAPYSKSAWVAVTPLRVMSERLCERLGQSGQATFHRQIASAHALPAGLSSDAPDE